MLFQNNLYLKVRQLMDRTLAHEIVDTILVNQILIDLQEAELLKTTNL